MSDIKLHDITSLTDVKGYVQALCNKPYAEQLKLAKERIQPLDYPENRDNDKAIIERNADLLASYYREYERDLDSNPDMLREFLAQKLGEEFIDLMGRHS